jgi:glycosyltransferase involved in cell wall biosynthesis
LGSIHRRSAGSQPASILRHEVQEGHDTQPSASPSPESTQGTSRPRLSVLIITLDAARMLDEVLQSVSFADEIVIVDSGSSDTTEEIARRYTDNFHVQPYAGHGRQRQRSLELASGDWVLYVDADEVVTPELRDSIQAAVATPGAHAGFRMQLHTWFMHEWVGNRGWRREWKTRLFRRDSGTFTAARIHEGAVVEGPIGTLKGALLHYPYRDLEHFAEKMNSYSSGVTWALAERGRRSSALGAVLRGGLRFFRDYVVGGEFLYGGRGLIRSALLGYYVFLKYAKLYEGNAAGGDAPRSAPRRILRKSRHGRRRTARQRY